MSSRGESSKGRSGRSWCETATGLQNVKISDRRRGTGKYLTLFANGKTTTKARDSRGRLIDRPAGGPRRTVTGKELTRTSVGNTVKTKKRGGDQGEQMPCTTASNEKFPGGRGPGLGS